jgi:hypothetical protein
MMTKRFAYGVVAGAVVCAVALLSPAALAGTGIGGVFNLGTTNKTNATTVLRGTTDGQQLRVSNSATGGSGVAGIGIHTTAGHPPLVVDSRTKVTNLNADLLDGQGAAAFVGGGGQVVSGSLEAPITGTTSTLLAVPGFGRMEATCPATGSGLVWRNVTNPSTALDLWVVTEGATRHITQPANNDTIAVTINEKDDRLFTTQVGRPGHTATMTVSAHWSPAGCVFHGQAVVQ